MLNLVRTRLAAAGLACLAVAAASFVVAQDNSGSTQSNQNAQQSSGQSSSIQTEGVQTNGLSKPETTEKQAKAPVVDPQAAAQDAAEGKGAGAQVGGALNPKTNNPNVNNSPSEWPAPQRYDANRGSSDNMRSRQGGASLGVNVVGTQDGVVVMRILPGTPAEEMGLRPRDRILSLNGQPVAAVDEFIAAIRGMNAGDQVQLSIDRDGNPRDISGQLQAFRAAVAAGEGPVGNIIGRAREIIRDRGDRFGENMQTSYQDGNQGGRQSSSDLEARLSRVEQQLNQIMRDLAEIRASGRANESNTNTALPNTTSNGHPTAREPSDLQATPGPSLNGLQPSTR